MLAHIIKSEDGTYWSVPDPEIGVRGNKNWNWSVTKATVFGSWMEAKKTYYEYLRFYPGKKAFIQNIEINEVGRHPGEI